MNEVEIVITSRNRAGGGIAAAWSEFKKLGADIRTTLATSGKQAGRDLAGGVQAGMKQAKQAAEAGMTEIARSVRVRGRETEREGRGLARRILSGVATGLKTGAHAVGSALKGVFSSLGSSGALGKAASTAMIGAIIGAVAGLTPQIAAAISGGLVLGMGGGIVAIGAMLLSEDKKIRKQWTSTWKDLKQVMTDAAEPLRPVLETTRRTLSSVVKDLAPEIEKGFETAQKPLQRFVGNLGKGFKNLKPAIAPLFTAFGGILDALGPKLPDFFKSLSDSVIDLANTVNENRDVIAMVFNTMLQTIPTVINLVSALTGTLRGMLDFVASSFDKFLIVVQGVMVAAAQIPGPWQEAAASVAASIQETRGRIAEWRNDVENFPKIVKLEGDIRDLETKISTAKTELNDPDLTKTRRAQLKADIAQLLAAKRKAQAEINSLEGKTVYLNFVQTIGIKQAPSVGVLKEAHGGIIGGSPRRFASGGIGSGTPAIVGEQGPELVNLPVGSAVKPAGQTRALMAGQGFGSMSMAFRAGGRSAAEPLREVVAALREILTLREGMSRFTDLIFGQERALSSYEAAWDNIRKSLKENKKTLNIGTEAGRNNRSALLDLASAAHEVVFAMADLGKPLGSVTKKMAEQRAEFIKAARSMGLTTAQARALADRYGLVPSKVGSTLKKERADTAYNTRAGKAGGGPAGGWTLTGERGAELVRLPFGSNVVAAGQTAAMLSGSGGGGSNSPIHITLKIGDKKLGEVLVDPMRKAVSSRGGNVQAVLGS